MLSSLLLLLACTSPPDPADVRAGLAAGQLERTDRLLDDAGDAAAADPVLAPVAAELDRWQAAMDQRIALSRASRELMRTTIEARIAAGRQEPARLTDAAVPLATAVAAWPDDAAFRALAGQLGEAADDAPPETAALVWGALAEIVADQPAHAATWRAKAAFAQQQVRYAPDAFAGTRAAQAGITRVAVADLLEVLDERYVDVLPHAAMAAAGRQALVRLARVEPAAARWPRLADVTWPPAGAPADLDGLQAALDAHLVAMSGADVPAEVVLDEWVTGALSALDPWTRAVWPAEIAAWEAHHAGVRVGIGVELREGPDGTVQIARPLPDTPAWEAGIHQGDVIVALSDPTGRLVLAEVAADRRRALAEAALAGAPGSTVTLELARGEEALTVTVARAPVVRETVQGWARGDDNGWIPWVEPDAGIAYARIDAFRTATPDALDALLVPVADRVRVVVLDLRGNPGGDIQAAVNVADRFVADGLLARIDGRVLPDTGPDVDPETGEALAEWNEAVSGHALEGVPVVVLVDPDTASAAEVLAAALQERAGAVVVGAPTWGKGWAQKLHTGNGYAMQYTNLAWSTPAGRRLARPPGGGDRAGVVPDVDLAPASPGEQYVLGAARDRRTSLRVHADGTPMAPLAATPRDDLPPLDDDPVLRAGVAVARGLLLPTGDPPAP